MTSYSRQELENALPDYLFGVAPAPVAEAIEALAESDADFASVLAAERRIAAALDEPREFELDRAAEHDFTRLKARIDSEAPARRGWLRSLMRPLPALAAAAVVAVGLFVLPADEDGFRTLSDDAGPAAGQVRVIFREPASAADVERFARRYSLTREAGPDTAGSYVFSIDDAQALPDVLQALREDASLTFVGERE